MSVMTSYKNCYFHSQDNLRLYYRDYYHADNALTPLLCLHGLTRNAADFNGFCEHFAPSRRIIVPDMRGRGKSAYDPHYKNYQIPTYLNDVLHLLTLLDMERVIVVGTSMGGLMAMGLAVARPGLLEAVILNDVGPEIDPAGLARIASYVGKTPVMEDWDQAITALKKVNAGFYPDFTETDWAQMARNTFYEKDSQIIPNYDPLIGKAMAEAGTNLTDVNMWDLFTALKNIPTLTLRGELSDILSAKTLVEMQQRHPLMSTATIPNRGHVPLLTETVSLDAITQFVSGLNHLPHPINEPK